MLALFYEGQAALSAAQADTAAAAATVAPGPAQAGVQVVLAGRVAATIMACELAQVGVGGCGGDESAWRGMVDDSPGYDECVGNNHGREVMVTGLI